MSPYEARAWYSWRKSQIADLVDQTKSLEEQAKEACEMRNTIRTTTRNAMKDADIADALNKLEKNKTWDEMVKDKIDINFKGDDIYKEIIKSSMKGRDVVDNLFKIPTK